MKLFCSQHGVSENLKTATFLYQNNKKSRLFDEAPHKSRSFTKKSIAPKKRKSHETYPVKSLNAALAHAQNVQSAGLQCRC